MKPAKLALLAFFVTLGLSLSGCSLCCSPYLDDYAAYGSRTPRMDMKHGRVGSIFSDPQLTGNAVPTAGSPSSNGQPVYFDSEGNEIELISGSEVIENEGPWGEAMDAIESNEGNDRFDE
jgi:hypothetical protein